VPPGTCAPTWTLNTSDRYLPAWIGAETLKTGRFGFVAFTAIEPSASGPPLTLADASD
jgi:hypothetical protein